MDAKLSSNEIINVYTANAPVYDIWAWLTETRARKQAVTFANVHDGEAILEVAVGTGLTFAELVKQNPRGLNRGVDLTPAMVERTRQRVSSLQGDIIISPGDATRLEFSDNQFDLLVNNYMFDLLKAGQFSEVLDEFRRVLKPAGRLVLTNMALPRYPWHGFWEMLYRVNPSLMGGCRGINLHDVLRENGFKVEESRYISQFGFPSEVILANPL